MTKILTLLAIAVSLTGYGWAYGGEIAQKTSLCQIAPKAANKSLLVPTGAIWKREAIRVPEAPAQFQALVGWVNVATVLPCSAPDLSASVEIRTLRIIERDPKTGGESMIQEISFDENRDGFQGRLFPRLNEKGQEQWFGPTEGSDVGVNAGLKGKEFLINLAETPNQIYHGWTHPRVPAKAGYNYFMEVEAKVSGAARLQIGADYWVDSQSDYSGYDEKCNAVNNCEAWISRWIGDTKGKFVTLRAPDSF